MDAVSHLSTALVGRYTVDREIGRGGMATVYLARDVRHNRHVALKVLNPELGAVLGVERFLAEIQVTAKLQHPNLLPLFDSGAVDGLLFYVMPFVDGESLRQRIDREKQLPVDDAVRIAGAIASALQYAHEHGVIHRDLKPENVLLQAGQPVIADFGIALAVSNAGGTRVTQTGLSLGTPQYMSPEQATGDRTIDGRSDIYALGAITYEMLSGDPPHLGSTAQAIIAKVLTERPPSVRLARPTAPEHVAAAVSRALEKLPADRWSTAREFAEALSGSRVTVRDTGRPSVRSAARSAWSRRTVAAIAGAALVGAALGAAAVGALRRSPPQPLSRFAIQLPDSAPLAGGTSRVAISRDGRQIAFVASRRFGLAGVYVQSLDDPEPRLVAGTENGASPIFSPDGRSIAFLQRGQLMKVLLAGGSPIRVADSVSRPDWRAGDNIVFTKNRSLYRVSNEGRGSTLVAAPDSSKGQFTFTMPSLLPGGRHVVFTIVRRNANADLAVTSIDGGDVVELGIDGSTARWDGHGNLLFVRTDGTLYAVPFSLRSMRATGVPTPLLQQAVVTTGIAAAPADYDVADDGTLVFVRGRSQERELVAVSRSGVARSLSDDLRAYGWPRVSPDGRRVALEIQEPGIARWDVWVFDVAPRTLTRLTTRAGIRPAGWTEDGRRVVFLTSDSAFGPVGRQLRAQQWDGGQPPEPLPLSVPTGLFDATIGPRGTYIAVNMPGSGGDIGLARRDSAGAVSPFVVTSATENQPRLSPDGRFLAYRSDETGSYEIYVRPVPGPGSRLQVSTGGGNEPVWSRDGQELFYRSSNHLISARLTLKAELAVARRDTLFVDSFARGNINYDVFPGSGDFLMIRERTGVAQVQVILNWQRLLDRR